ncbi:MAG: hypothetical protein CTY10_09900 [Methylotenera sp.]|nr:MAG: hypothetical protein CTY10_09900 [Methylotenera sp.]
MQKQILPLLCISVLLTLVTVISFQFFNALSITGVTLLNLLVVMTAAYWCDFLIAVVTAFLAFLCINYFFIEPLYTFEVAHLQSWVVLGCFLIVSIIISSLVKQLKYQTEQSLTAKQHAQFARMLAEKLALSNDVQQLLQDTCNLLQAEFNRPFCVASFKDKQYSLSVTDFTMPNARLFEWVSANGKAISPYTDYWTELITPTKQWLIPFSRVPSTDPILVMDKINDEDTAEKFSAIKSCVDQISQAYQRLIQSDIAKKAELVAQEEAIQSALLASISHDMRTPLTSILGAATTLQQVDLTPEQAKHLNNLIASQARYLADTTENILSLIHLESNQTSQIAMDWQSPEELIGIVTALYQSRGESLNLLVNISDAELLIEGNANLLVQALVNLIDNAKQIHTSTEPILIEVIRESHFINICINDRGSGFDAGFSADKIKKFSSTKGKGFGLGLSIVQAIVSLHKGLLSFRQRPGGGACVVLSFPASVIATDSKHV